MFKRGEEGVEDGTKKGGFDSISNFSLLYWSDFLIHTEGGWSVARALGNAETTGVLQLRGYGLQLFPDVAGYTLDDVVDLGM